ncbi:MAG: phosphoglucosamine mutase [bacterium]|nr:phosphoglucosamine mutase [bacterium]
MTRMFGTDGVRGVANIEPMTSATVMNLGQAMVEVLSPLAPMAEPFVVVGRDTRRSGPMFEAALAAGLYSMGVNVLNVGIMPTPGVAYLTRARQALAGIVISASHNPFDENGIKIFNSTGAKLDDALEDAIETRMRSLSADGRRTGQGIGIPLASDESLPSYTDFLKSAFCPSSSLEFRVGLDCANGAASRVAPALFEQLGVPTLVWHASPDGVNINQQCGALHPEFLQRKVRDERLDLGFAFDGDADRLIAIDHTGEILDGDYILAICAQALNTAGALCPRAVVSTVMSNLGLDRALRNLGIVLHQTQVGDRYVMQAMQHHGAILGGEQSGHIIFLKHQTTGDGLLSAIQLLNAVSSQQAPLADLAQVLFKFPQVLINVAIQRRDDPLNYPHVQHALQNAQAALGDEGRVLVRLSGTEPVARVMVEGPEQTLIESLAQRIAQAVASELGCG